jgi:AcrR family transcriptional regulator
MTEMKPKTRVPKQQRSIDKKNRIMNAAMALFARKGIHQTNSKEIAAEAGVAIGSFYCYFPDKRKLLTEVLEIYLNNHFGKIWEDGLPQDTIPSPQIIRHFMENVLNAYDMAPDFHRETHVLRYSDPEVKALYDKETEKELKQIIAVLTQYKDRMSINDMDAAAVVIHSAAENLAHKIKFMGTLDESRLIGEFTDMIFRYLAKGM